jgi:hypothetical protein
MFDPNKQKKNTTDRRLNLPMMRNDAKTNADMAATRTFANTLKSQGGGFKQALNSMKIQPGNNGAQVSIKNPDYVSPRQAAKKVAAAKQERQAAKATQARRRKKKVDYKSSTKKKKTLQQGL